MTSTIKFMFMVNTIALVLVVLIVCGSLYFIVANRSNEFLSDGSLDINDRVDQAVDAGIQDLVSAVQMANAGRGTTVTTTIGAHTDTPPVSGQSDAHTPSGNPSVGGQPPSASKQQPRMHARWTQLIPPSKACGAKNPNVPDGEATDCTPRILVRAIIDDQEECSKVRLRLRSGTTYPMDARERPKQEGFPVQVCEMLLDIEDEEVEFADGKKLIWTGLQKLDSIAVIGDTGCDPANGQECVDASWPFRRIAKQAAGGGATSGAAPDLVIHVGDYRYLGESSGDNWENWKKDFFDPAKPLLEAAPWIMARGNHESCHGKQGPGWFYFLQPDNPYVSRCPTLGSQDESDNLPPFAIDLGTLPGSEAPPRLRLIVLDSTYAKYQCKRWAQEWTRKLADDLPSYAKRFEDFMTTSAAQDTWVITHYPVWDVSAHLVPSDNDEMSKYLRCEGKYYNARSVHTYRKLVASAIENASDKGEKPSVVLSGDTHHFQVLRAHHAGVGGPSEQSDEPLQLVVGHSGTLMVPGLGASGPQPDPLTEDTCERLKDGDMAYFQRELKEGGKDEAYWVLGKAVCRYGSVAATYDDDGWTLDLVGRDVDNEPAATSCWPEVSGPSSCYHDRADRYCVKLGRGITATAQERECDPFVE